MNLTPLIQALASAASDTRNPDVLETHFARIIDEHKADLIRLVSDELMLQGWVPPQKVAPEVVQMILPKGVVAVKEEPHASPFTEGKEYRTGILMKIDGRMMLSGLQAMALGNQALASIMHKFEQHPDIDALVLKREHEADYPDGIIRLPKPKAA